MMYRAEITRRVTTVNGTVEIDDEPDETPLWVELASPVTSADLNDSPREQPATTLRHGVNLLAPASPLQAGDRLFIYDGVWEVLGTGREIRAGSRLLSVDFGIMRIEQLWPYALTVQEMGGTEVETEVPFAVWDQSTENEDRGQYGTWEAEAPPETLDTIMSDKNRQVIFSDVPHRIVDPILELAPPRVRMTLRGAR